MRSGRKHTGATPQVAPARGDGQPPARPRYRVIGNVWGYKIGDSIELGAEDAKKLIELRVVELVNG